MQRSAKNPEPRRFAKAVLVRRKAVIRRRRVVARASRRVFG
jgi:hypothetical protein